MTQDELHLDIYDYYMVSASYTPSPDELNNKNFSVKDFVTPTKLHSHTTLKDSSRAITPKGSSSIQDQWSTFSCSSLSKRSVLYRKTGT